MTRAQVPAHDEFDVEEEVRKSLTAIEQERSRRLWLAVFAMVAILLIAGVFVYLLYTSGPVV